MKQPVTTTGVTKLLRRLKAAQIKASADHGLAVDVGYAAPHAVHVHEDMEAHHEVGQAKYLEYPARLYAEDIQKAVAQEYQKSHDLEKALLTGGRLLLELSQPLVPVDTGELKASGFVEVVPRTGEDELPQGGPS